MVAADIAQEEDSTADADSSDEDDTSDEEGEGRVEEGEEEEVWVEGVQPLAPELKKMLGLIISRPRHDATLLRALRALATDHVTSLLQFLLGIMERWGFEGAQEREIKGADEETGASTAAAVQGQRAQHTPSLAQVLDWTMLLLDAHLARLVVIPSCHGLLRRWVVVVERHEQLALLLAPLKGVLAQLSKDTGALFQAKERAKAEQARLAKLAEKHEKRQERKQGRKNKRKRQAEAEAEAGQPPAPGQQQQLASEPAGNTRKAHGAAQSTAQGLTGPQKPYSIEVIVWGAHR